MSADFGEVRCVRSTAGLVDQREGTDQKCHYITVRRLFRMVEDRVNKGMEWAVFEPNEGDVLEEFLVTRWLVGSRSGETPREAFCGALRLDHDDFADYGRMICRVGIAPAKPAEVVVFRISVRLVRFRLRTVPWG